MGKLDVSALAARLTELNSNSGGNGSGGGISWLNLKDGRNVIRILPPKGDGVFAKEVFVHFGVNKTEENKRGTMVVCPKTHGDNKPCPVCDVVAEMRKLSKKKDDKYDKMARELNKKTRVYYNVIDRADDLDTFEKKEVDGKEKWFNADDEEETPIKVFGSGIGIYKALLALIIDPEYGDITDEDEGLDIIITKSGTGYNTKYEVKSVRKESVIGFDNWEEESHDLNPLAKAKSYDEIDAILNGEEPEDKDDDDEEEDEKEEKPKKADKKVKAKKEEKEEEEEDSDSEGSTEEGGDSLQDEIAAKLAARKKRRG
ncbi:MAG TPA: hypothetical protein VGN87_06335 [Paenibacillus sp.]